MKSDFAVPKRLQVFDCPAATVTLFTILFCHDSKNMNAHIVSTCHAWKSMMIFFRFKNIIGTLLTSGERLL